LREYVFSFAVIDLSKAKKPEGYEGILHTMHYDFLTYGDHCVFVINPNRADIESFCSDTGSEKYTYERVTSDATFSPSREALISKADDLVRTTYAFIKKDELIRFIRSNISDKSHTVRHRMAERAIFYETPENKQLRQKQVEEALSRNPDIKKALDKFE